MATVTGYTAERMKQIEDESVVGGSVVGDNLVLVTRDGTPIDAGPVIGPQGNQGPAGTPASFAGYQEPILDLGNVSGTITLNWGLYNNWRINPVATTTLVFSGLPPATHIKPGTLIVANSSFALVYPAGTKYPGGVAPILSGETWLSMAARSTHVTVSNAWAGVA